jgi:plasmid maintenance system antidote protein VapI
MKEPPAGSPGEWIRDWLASDANRWSGWNQADLAWILGISQKHMTALIHGHNSLTPMMAVKLEEATGMSAEDLLIVEARYRIARIRQGVQ